MLDTRSPKAERPVQQPFRKSSVFSYLALAALILAGQILLRLNRPALDLAPAIARIAWIPVKLAPLTDRRARVAGFWELKTSDRRIGGISALALDQGRLLALTDGGMIVRLPVPPGSGASDVRPLPAVPGNPRTKLGRDSEALARDPEGRGWWVAFEQRHQLILYDSAFRRALKRVEIASRRFRKNRGVEALAGGQALRWYAERTGISDAATSPSGRIFLLRRGPGLAGLRPSVDGLGGRPLHLPLGRFDNAEGIAIEPRAGGALRLWIITDNEFRRWQPTRLLAIDLVQAAAD